MALASVLKAPCDPENWSEESQLVVYLGWLSYIPVFRIRIRIRIHMFWTSWIRNHLSEVWIWIRILLSSSKNSKKNLDFYRFVTYFGLYIFEKLCKCTFKNNKQKNFIKKLVFCWPLEGQ
jgi:hypothetical protein